MILWFVTSGARIYVSCDAAKLLITGILPSRVNRRYFQQLSTFLILSTFSRKFRFSMILWLVEIQTPSTLTLFSGHHCYRSHHYPFRHVCRRSGSWVVVFKLSHLVQLILVGVELKTDSLSVNRVLWTCLRRHLRYPVSVKLCWTWRETRRLV